MSSLLVRDLAQLATPSGTDAPLRGAALDKVDVFEGDVWIASQFGEIVAVGHGFDLRPRLARKPAGLHRARPAQDSRARPRRPAGAGVVPGRDRGRFARHPRGDTRAGGGNRDLLTSTMDPMTRAQEWARRFNENQAVWRCYEHKRALRKLLGSRCPLPDEILDELDWRAAERECRPPQFIGEERP